jgi:transcriptional regulator with XRE-family HTH domain
MTVGTKIKKIRELRNYTQEYMADKLQMSQSGYSKIESNEVDVAFSKLEQISEVLGMKVEDVISFDEKHVFNNYGTAHDKSFSVFYQAISDKERELYEKTIALLEEKVKRLEGGK